MRKLTSFVAVTLAVALAAGTAAAAPAGRGPQGGGRESPTGDAGARRPSAVRMNFALDQPLLSAEPGRQPYVVRLFSDPVLGYTGGVPGIRATVGAAAAAEVSATSPDAVRYTRHLESLQSQLVGEASRSIGRSLDVMSSMTYGDNMVVLELTRGEAVSVSKVPGVIAVSALPDREPQTDTSLDTIDALDLWTVDPDGGGALAETKGDGIVIGVIDTGVSPYNPSFAPSPGQDNALGDGQYLGVCADGNWNLAWGPFPCNDKLVGMYSWPLGGDGSGVDTAGFDVDGHGSHTASTAAGAAVTVDPYGGDRDISGVAPNASIVMYGGCCFAGGLDLAAAIDQAAADSFSGLLDVINYSVGASGAGDPWQFIGQLPLGTEDEPQFVGWDAVAFFYIRFAADTFVAVSNGNDGPGYLTTGSPASAPWVTSVGASATERYWTSTLTLPANSAGAFSISAVAASDTISAELVRADADDLTCEDDTGHQANYTGKIVFCDRGGIPFVEKAENVRAQGAVGFVAQNNTNALDPVPITFPIPGLYISGANGEDVLVWLAGDGPHLATISSTLETDATRLDEIADFSSRGPNTGAEVINPSLVAPGVDILAALADPANTANSVWGAISGTSMASPHVAGSAALLRQLHPGWSAAQIQSALMTTASPTVHDLAPGDADIADVDTQGSGRINVERASRAGLLFDIDPLDFYVEDPNFGGDPKLLNLPSFANYACVQHCSWDRVATLATPGVVWSVDPDQHELGGLDVDVELDASTPGELGIHVMADVTAMGVDEWADARITLTPDWAVPSADPLPPEVTLPLAVVAALADVPDSVAIATRRDVGSAEFGAVSVPVVEFESTVAGLAQADVHAAELAGDPTADDAFDDLSQVDVYTFAVPAGTDRVAVELLAADMADADIFLGGGTIPSDATLIAASTTSGSDEFINLDLPAPGAYWVVIQNWESSDQTFTTPDAYRLAIGVVPGQDAGNLTVVGPEPGATEYPVGLVYDLTGSPAGAVWYGTLALGGGNDAPDEFGYVQVTIVREADDVTIAVSSPLLEPGDTVGYTVTVAANVTGVDLAYDLSVTVPSGLVVTPASVTGGGTVTGQTIVWDDVPVAAGGSAVVLEYTATVAADAPAGTATTTVTHTTSDPFAVPVQASADVVIDPPMLQPVAPKRLFDTRPTEPQGAITVAQHTYGGDDVLRVNLLGVAGIGGGDVAAVALNVTAVDPAGPGYVTVYPCSAQRPLVSNINFQGPGAYPNAVIAPLSTDGELCLYSKVQTHLIADVVGWFPAGAGIGTVAPERLFDTRTTEPHGSIQVPKASIGGEGKILKVKVAGVSGVPATGAAAVALNVTAVNPVAAGYVTVYPCNADRPLVSNINYSGPGVYPNAVLTPLSADGEVCFYSKADTDLIADVNAWFPADGDFGPLDPVRLFDTRITEPSGVIAVDKRQYGGDASILTVKVTGVGGVPLDGVGMVSLNVTAVDPTGPGYVTVFPCGVRPVVSNVNFAGPGVYPNAVLTPVSENGEVCFYSKVPTDLIADVNGWFAAP